MKLQSVIGTLWIGPGNDVEHLLRTDTYSYYTVGEMYERKPGILNVAHDYKNYEHPNGIVYLHAGLVDGSDDHTIEWHSPNRLEDYVAAVLGLDYLVRSCTPVFVHCHSGRSRSCIVCAIYLSIVYNCTLDIAIDCLSKHYPHTRINPGHLEKARKTREELLALPNPIRSDKWLKYWPEFLIEGLSE